MITMKVLFCSRLEQLQLVFVARDDNKRPSLKVVKRFLNINLVLNAKPTCFVEHVATDNRSECQISSEYFIRP